LIDGCVRGSDADRITKGYGLHPKVCCSGRAATTKCLSASAHLVDKGGRTASELKGGADKVPDLVRSAAGR
jgi:hypothetical protein